MDYRRLLLHAKCWYNQNIPALINILKRKWQKLNTHQRLFVTFVIIEIFLLMSSILIPEHGKILPVGKNVVEAYQLLKKSPTGMHLVKRVKKISSGSFIYLTLGEPEKDDLFDYSGIEVRALTRAVFHYLGRNRIPNSITVIANKRILGSDPKEVVRSLAFELENVYYAYEERCHECGKDSPFASLTREMVTDELGL
jgi:hypothetical protein